VTENVCRFRTLSMSPIFSDILADRLHSGGLDLLHAVDRERRRYLHEPEKSHSLQEGRVAARTLLDYRSDYARSNRLRMRNVPLIDFRRRGGITCFSSSWRASSTWAASTWSSLAPLRDGSSRGEIRVVDGKKLCLL